MRTFSAHRRLKTYLAENYNESGKIILYKHLCMHVHKDRTDKIELCIDEIANSRLYICYREEKKLFCHV